jgi:uncharacterized protein with PQ loop repeat
MNVLAMTAAVFGVIMGAAPALQLYRMVRLRSSHDVSMAFFAVAATGQLTWVAYGIALHNTAVVLSNGCGMLVNTAVFVTAMVLRTAKLARA